MVAPTHSCCCVQQQRRLWSCFAGWVDCASSELDVGLHQRWFAHFAASGVAEACRRRSRHRRRRPKQLEAVACQAALLHCGGSGAMRRASRHTTSASPSARGPICGCCKGLRRTECSTARTWDCPQTGRGTGGAGPRRPRRHRAEQSLARMDGPNTRRPRKQRLSVAMEVEALAREAGTAASLGTQCTEPPAQLLTGAGRRI